MSKWYLNIHQRSAKVFLILPNSLEALNLKNVKQHIQMETLTVQVRASPQGGVLTPLVYTFVLTWQVYF